MDYMNIPYEEEENSGILGIMALGRSVPQLKVNNISDYFRAIFQIPQADLTITNSADILRYLYGCHAGMSSVTLTMKYAFSKKFDLCNKSCLMRKGLREPSQRGIPEENG